MSTHRSFEKICVVVTAFMLLITVLFMNGSSLGIEMIIDEDTELHAHTVYFTENDLNGQWSTSGATVITLNGDSAGISGKGAYFYDGNLVIRNGGKYVLSGKLTDGSIVVKTHKNSKVWLLLDNVDLYCSDDACLRIDKADKVFLTLAEGSENRMESGTNYSAEALADKTGGVIFAHDDLTINGNGSLTLYAAYKHGIDANDELVITGGKVSITAVQDAVHVNDGFCFRDGELIISAGDDGIHSETSVYIESGSIEMLSCYEGLEAVTIDVAGGNILIYPKDDGLNANGRRENFFGMGSFPGIRRQDDAVTEDTAAEEETWVHVSGGLLTIINENARDADGIDSNGDILITGGSIRVSLINNGTNSALDYGSESGGTCIITGGDVIACGSYTMAEGFESNSEQCSILYNLREGVNAGTEVTLEDKDGNILLTYTVPCSFSSVVLSCPEMQLGETYLLVIGDSEDEITLGETAASYGDVQSTMFFGSMNWGGMQRPQGEGGVGRGRRGSAGENNQIPEMPDFDREKPDMGSFMGEIPQPPEQSNTGNTILQQFPEGQDFHGKLTDMSPMPQPPEPNGWGEMPQFAGSESIDTEVFPGEIKMFDRQTMVLSCASVLLLLAGIVIAKKFRK